MRLNPNALKPALLSLLGMLFGCASMTGPVSYPQSWPPPTADLTANGCPNLAGVYANRAEAHAPKELGGGPRLTDVFARMARATGLTAVPPGKAWHVPEDAESVAIVQAPEALRVVFLDRGRELSALEFRRYRFSWSERRYDDLYTCYTPENGPRLRYFAEPESHSIYIPNLYLGGGGTLVFMLRAADGSLVVQWRNESVGISAIVVGTHFSFDSVWWRYPRM